MASRPRNGLFPGLRARESGQPPQVSPAATGALKRPAPPLPAARPPTAGVPEQTEEETSHAWKSPCKAQAPVYRPGPGFMENGLVNLAAIVGWLILLISTIPIVLLLPTRRSSGSPDKQS